MTGTNVEGTIVLNGLVEGPLPDDPDFRDRLRAWARDVAKLGLDFHPEITGGSFSLLPGNEPRSCRALGDAPHEAICQALEQLLDPLPPGVARRVTSTLRSSQFRKGEEVQAVYMIRADGHVQVERRAVAAETEAAPRPLAARDVVRMLIVGLVTAAALLGITSLFVDIPSLARQLIGTIRPVSAHDITIDNDTYAAYFSAAVKEISGDKLTLTLDRTDQFPTTDAMLQRAADATQGKIKEWLAVAALARGHVPIELFDADGKHVATATIRIEGLRTEPSINVDVPLKTNPRFRLGRIVFAL